MRWGRKRYALLPLSPILPIFWLRVAVSNLPSYPILQHFPIFMTPRPLSASNLNRHLKPPTHYRAGSSPSLTPA
jgi:hypothetical protein